MWEHIVGHEIVKKTLINALKNDKVAHAYLLTGPAGIGKQTVARTFAQAFLCRREDGNPCNECITCKKIITGNYPDLNIIEPIGGSLKIDQIRELQKSCQYKPYEGVGKVYVIKQAETMTAEAANCLLKVLEEPVGNTVFLLTAENSYALLPTIVSRCQRLDLRPVSTDKLAEWLVTKEIELDQAKVISSLSHGVPGNALDMATEDSSGRRRSMSIKAGQMQNADIVSALRIAEDMDNKDRVLLELDLLAVWYRDLLIWSVTKEKKLLINVDLIGEIEEQANVLNPDKIKIDLNKILLTKKNIQANANLRLSLENLLLKLMKSA